MTQQILTTPAEQNRKERSKAFVRVIAALAILFALVVVAIFPHLARQRDALAAVNEAAKTQSIVNVTHAKLGEPTSELVLPGNIQPLYTADLYARVDGYLERRGVDIGSKVKSGQLLAVISSPEIDQQLLQARATLAQSEASVLQAKAALQQENANAELTRLTKERDLPLGKEHAISQQIVDGAVQGHDASLANVAAAEANITAAEATVKANQANVERLLQMQGFERIVAPFDGIITARNVERGDLVSTGNTASKPLFSIAQSGTLRIQVDVPQSEAVNIKDGQTAAVDVQERSGNAYTGTVIRNAAALDNAARTLLTEVQVDNRDGSLLPGMYAKVKFTLSQDRRSLIIPTSALVINSAGMHVVTVDSANIIHFNKVIAGKDLGTTIEIMSGVQASESIVASPNDLLREGEHVQIR
jgi:RND family efflux transporter MFP subunit